MDNLENCSLLETDNVHGRIPSENNFVSNDHDALYKYGCFLYCLYLDF